ncbi:MAG: membrane dipeptidase [Chloroflexi bacterium]|nr:membrane dipeptidase [Chloroflexota bacterium]
MSIVEKLPIIDGHNDVLLRLYLKERGPASSFFTQSHLGHLDLPRARLGNFTGGFFAIYVPQDPSVHETAHPEPTAHPEQAATETEYAQPLASAVEFAYAQPTAIAMMALLFRLEAESEGQVKIVRTVEDLNVCLIEGAIAVVFHLEGAEPIDPGCDALYIFHAAGLRSLGLVWSRPNSFATGVPFRFPHSPDTGPGLTEAGQNLVRTCNRLGIMLDLSHLNEKGFWDVAALTDAPLVATHSGVHAICPSTRNLTDRQLDAIGESGGIVGINFHVAFLRPDGRKDANTPLTAIADHIDYIAQRIGIDHVALGSDFDGATMPQELGDVAGLPKLMHVLQQRGYDEAALRKISHENWMRVLRETWK